MFHLHKLLVLDPQKMQTDTVSFLTKMGRPKKLNTTFKMLSPYHSSLVSLQSVLINSGSSLIKVCFFIVFQSSGVMDFLSPEMAPLSPPKISDLFLAVVIILKGVSLVKIMSYPYSSGGCFRTINSLLPVFCSPA